MANGDTSYDKELLAQWTASLPYEHHPTGLGAREVPDFKFSELARRYWGDLSNLEYNPEAKNAREKGWVDEQGEITKAGRIELLQREGIDKGAGKKVKKNGDARNKKKEEKLAAEMRRFADAGTPQTQVQALLGKYGFPDGYSAIITRERTRGCVIKFIVPTNEGIGVEKVFSRDSVEQVLGAFEDYLKLVAVRLSQKS